jgi:transposase
MAITRARIYPAAKEYVDRKVSDGKSKREAIRCLKRQLANVVYCQMIADARRLAHTT